MHLKEYLQHLYDYSYWANHRYLNAAQGLTDEQLHHKQGHSWDSVHGVLLHMMSSETVWLKRWRGDSPAGHLSPADFPTFESIQANWAGLEKQVRDYLAAQSEASLEADISYVNFEGKTYHFPLWQLMAHVPNHNTHHRGELAAMFAMMNALHPEDEVVQYFLDVSGQKKA